MADSVTIYVDDSTPSTVVEIQTTGQKGDTGAAGTDGADGQGVPVGGTANQILEKIDGTDYNTQWTDKPISLTDGSVTLAKLNASLKTRVTANVVTSYAINHNNGNVFELTMTGATTFTDSNLPTGTVTKDFLVILDGNFVPTFPTYWEATPNSKAYDGTVRNWIVVSVINGTGSSEDVVYEITNLST